MVYGSNTCDKHETSIQIMFLLKRNINMATARVVRFAEHTTVGKTPSDEWSARRRDLYVTSDDIHKRQTSMP
jgi:hypothetical protein